MHKTVIVVPSVRFSVVPDDLLVAVANAVKASWMDSEATGQGGVVVHGETDDVGGPAFTLVAEAAPCRSFSLAQSRSTRSRWT